MDRDSARTRGLAPIHAPVNPEGSNLASTSLPLPMDDEREKLACTRSRAYQENDLARAEQTYGAAIRRFVGYERFAGLIAG